MVNQYFTGVLIGIIVIGGIGYYITSLNDENSPDFNFEDYGQAPDFTLNNMYQQPITFKDYDDKVRVLTFVYTKCTAGCSTNVIRMLNILFSLNNQNYSDEIQFFTIDFDYIHDNYTSLQEYASIMLGENPLPTNMEFLFGTETEINQTAKDWDFYFELSESPLLNTTETGGGMDMELNNTMHMGDEEHPAHEVVWTHPFVVYLIDKNGDIRKKIWGLEWEQDLLEEMIRELI
ncbi:MAG: SCO family protein [Candidatus Heimdallarchaeota archaeon]|nr:SCO family protein [Candidatus Heimdallarchaeota archaeon]